MMTMEEAKLKYRPLAQDELNKLVEHFNEEFKDILQEIGYNSISDTGRRRPITFIRTMFCELVHEISPLFGHRWKTHVFKVDNTKLIDQTMVATVLGIDRSTMPHHHKKYEFDRTYFSPLVERLQNIRQNGVGTILKLRSLVDKYESERNKALTHHG